MARKRSRYGFQVPVGRKLHLVLLHREGVYTLQNSTQPVHAEYHYTEICGYYHSWNQCSCFVRRERPTPIMLGGFRDIRTLANWGAILVVPYEIVNPQPPLVFGDVLHFFIVVPLEDTPYG